MSDWTAIDSPRIWRLPGLSSWQDETAKTDQAGSDAAMAAIAAAGFNGVWIFCDMYDLMASTTFPSLNRPGAAARRASLRATVARARSHGLGVWLYFNEPGGVPQDHAFWQEEPGRIEAIGGATRWNLRALCTSLPVVRAFFREAMESIFAALPGVAGVILITACENLTHCWSKVVRVRGEAPPACPRCRDREPAELVLELLEDWAGLRARHGFRVLAWNWEWAYWYADPPRAIVDGLPAGFELLLDLEIGDTTTVAGRTLPVREYALSVPGPSPRLCATQDAVAGHGIPVHAKAQWNATHELCTVPHVPVLATLHHKLRSLTERGVAGFMGCWTIGCGLTLNTFAVDLYRRDPAACADETRFLERLGVMYFGIPVGDASIGRLARLASAWRGFSAAWRLYPFCVPILYYGPHNDAPVRAMSLHYEGVPIARSFMGDAPGDDFTRCVSGEIDAPTAAACYEAMADAWDAALPDYAAALAGPVAGGGGASEGGGPVAGIPTAGAVAEATAEAAHAPDFLLRRAEALRTARVIGAILRSTSHHYRFHARRAELLAEHGLTAPCELPRDPALLDLMRAEAAVCITLLPMLREDPRLGFHEEFQGWKFDAERVAAKLDALHHTLETTP